MNYLNISIPEAVSGDFAGAENDEIGIWLRLMMFCAAQENGGIIRNCEAWTERTWMASAGLSKADAHRSSPLWAWQAEGLVVLGYPIKQEAAVAAKRKGAVKGLARRWAKPDEGEQESPIPPEYPENPDF